MKLLFITLNLLFTTFILSSQIYLGWNAGLNTSEVKFDNEEYNESFKHIGRPKFGYSAGINSYFYFSKVLDLKTDILYTTKGFRYEQTYYYGHKTLNYGQINLQGQIDLNPDADIIFSPYIGSYAAYWISGKSVQTDLRLGYTDKEDIYLKRDSTFAYKRYDSGISAGIDMKFNQPNYKLIVIGIKYELGMITTDIDKVAGWKNRNLNIYFKYYYRVKR